MDENCNDRDQFLVKRNGKRESLFDVENGWMHVAGIMGLIKGDDRNSIELIDP